MMSTTTTITSSVLAVAAGAASWTAVEYGLHRFAMHELRGRGLASKQHLKHHADVTYFTPTHLKVVSAGVTTAVVLPAAWAVAGPRTAVAFTAGLVGMYAEYEVTHRRLHTHAPRNRYGRWMRKSHFHHHFGGPMRNFGVTTNLFDRLLSSYDEPGVITVPRRHAPVWLLDEHGDVTPEHASDYVVKGPRSTDDGRAEAERARDQADAFANRVPVIDAIDATATTPAGVLAGVRGR